MADKITYSVLEIHAGRIRELVESKKYKNPDDFLKTALEILLTWESAHPEECMGIMKDLMPFSPEQEGFMKQTMVPEEIKKQFGGLGIDEDKDEVSRQKTLALRDDDHLKLRDNYQYTKKYIEALKITKPENIIPYDGHPILSGFYSRLLPVKIVLTVLCHLLEKSKESKIELSTSRVQAYDIAEEIAETLSKYEKEHEVKRNNKKSTGLPKKGQDDKDEEKIAMAQKRFKDQYVGKVRKSRSTKANHFEGALSALGLVYAFKEEGKVYVSLTELGKKFFLIDNPIVQGDYGKGPLTKLEVDFISKQLIPQRELEQKFVETVISVVALSTESADEKISLALDDQIKKAAVAYLKKNPKVQEMYNINHLEAKNETTQRKISQWRLATMGRLAEMKVVNWTINEKGDSEYSLN